MKPFRELFVIFGPSVPRVCGSGFFSSHSSCSSYPLPQFFLRNRIRQPERDEISCAFLPPMREMAVINANRRSRDQMA